MDLFKNLASMEWVNGNLYKGKEPLIRPKVVHYFETVKRSIEINESLIKINESMIEVNESLIEIND